MGNEKYFDQNVVLYDQYRPRYCKELFEDIISYGKITSSCNILEIGCGTGNATLPFIKTGADITAVELGHNLAHFTALKFSNYPNFTVVNGPFEKYITDNKYNLIFSATAFHWIENGIGYPRCYELLKDGGALAVFWNTPRISDENPKMNRRIQDLYRTVMPNAARDDFNVDQWYQNRCQNAEHIMGIYGFQDIRSDIYFNARVMNPDEYIGLLHTYSDHMALPNPQRETFFGKIHAVIKEYGSITITDTIDLHMGRK